MSGSETSAEPTPSPGPGTTPSTPGGSPACAGELGEAQRGERRRAGRLHHGGVPRGQRRRDLPAGDQEREVPGHDQRAGTQRLAEREREAGRVDRRRGSRQLGRRPRVVLEAGGAAAHLPARIGDRLAGVARLEDRELLRLRAHPRREIEQHAPPRGGAQPGPGALAKCPARGRGGPPRVRARRARHLRERRAGGRLEHGRDRARLGVLRAAVDPEPEGIGAAPRRRGRCIGAQGINREAKRATARAQRARAARAVSQPGPREIAPESSSWANAA